jgi:hypothetical protein
MGDNILKHQVVDCKEMLSNNCQDQIPSRTEVIVSKPIAKQNLVRFQNSALIFLTLYGL